MERTFIIPSEVVNGRELGPIYGRETENSLTMSNSASALEAPFKTLKCDGCGETSEYWASTRWGAIAVALSMDGWKRIKSKGKTIAIVCKTCRPKFRQGSPQYGSDLINESLDQVK